MAEFLRGDDRGATIVSFLSPSQLIALLMIIGSVVLFFVEYCIEAKQALQGDGFDKMEKGKNDNDG